ncbi:MAG: phytanoyl-CoA dioxygenase family protein [Proteobacteria bacterium]|nr:MAG: phytanoyl-CoA dioxygenase family protein [Pseudomonadota bacterium]
MPPSAWGHPPGIGTPMNQQARFTPGQVERFHDRGWVVPDYRLPAAVLDEMRREYRQLLERNPGIRSDIMLGPHLETPGAQGVRGSRRWLEFATRPPLLDLAAQLIGEDIVLWGTTLFGKPARSGKKTPWHQDGDYYPIEPLRTLTIWIALDDVTPRNGPMRFIPGSHRERRIFPHHWEEDDSLTINQVCDSEYFDSSTAQPLLLEAGQMSFHDVYMIHGSEANATDRRRAAFIVRLMPADCFYNHARGQAMAEPHQAHDYGRRPLFLVRGKDASGRNDFTVGHAAN